MKVSEAAVRRPGWVVALVLLGVLCVAVAATHGSPLSPSNTVFGAAVRGQQATRTPPPPSPQSGSHGAIGIAAQSLSVAALLVFVAIGIGILVVVVAVVRWALQASRRFGVSSRELSAAEDVLADDERSMPTAARRAATAAVMQGIDDLESEEPRPAVIACWQRLERAAAAAGAPPAASETPAQLVQRLSRALPLTHAKLWRLHGLFVQARFSPGRIDASMRDEARLALRSLAAELGRGELAVASPEELQ